MAENLKKKLLEKEKAIDIICGPDAYRNLPHMLAAVDGGGPAAGATGSHYFVEIQFNYPCNSIVFHFSQRAVVAGRNVC